MMRKVFSLFVLLFVITAFISAQTPQFYNFNNGTGNNSFPFNMSGGKAVNSLFRAGEFTNPTPIPAGQQITKVYFRVGATAGSPSFTNLHILLAQDVITDLTSGTFYPGPYDTVFVKDTTIVCSTGGWAAVQLRHPFPYDPTKSLIMFVGQCGYSGSGFTIYNSTLTGTRRVWSASGCPFTPYASADGSMINFGVDVEPVPTPPVSVNSSIVLPTPGVNTNYVAVPYNAGMVGWGNNITIEAWVKPGGTSTANTVLNKGAGSFDYQLGISATTMLPFFRAGSSIATCPFTVSAGVWSHLAVTSNGSTVIFYLNGVAGAPVTLASTLGSSSGEMRIGRGNNDAGSGKIDELRLWSVVRTAGEISANMCNKWIPNNTPGLKAKWHFDSTLVDSVNGWNGTIMGTIGYDTAVNCTVTSIPTVQNEMIRDYRLSQNYPNPFNPVTKISYDIPKSGFVSIKIYDIVGKEIATLVNENKNQGRYIVDFDGSSIASGTYFYRLECNGFVATKKMMLIK